MSQDNDTFNPFDPTGMLKTLRDSNLEAWSKTMIQLVNSEAYARATGAMLDGWLATSGPFRKALDSAMAQALANLNLPSRAEMITLAERLTNIEMRLDDMDARLDEALRPIPAPVPGAARKTTRGGRGHAPRAEPGPGPETNQTPGEDKP